MELDKLMRDKSITNIQLAEYFSTTSATISRWRNNINQPDINLLPQICELLECTLDQLLGIDQVHHYQVSPAVATETFVEAVSKLLDAIKNIDEPAEIAALVKDIAHNGEANDLTTQQFIEELGEAVIKVILFLRALPTTPEAQKTLRMIESEFESVQAAS